MKKYSCKLVPLATIRNWKGSSQFIVMGQSKTFRTISVHILELDELCHKINLARWSYS